MRIISVPSMTPAPAASADLCSHEDVLVLAQGLQNMREQWAGVAGQQKQSLEDIRTVLREELHAANATPTPAQFEGLIKHIEEQTAALEMLAAHCGRLGQRLAHLEHQFSGALVETGATPAPSTAGLSEPAENASGDPAALAAALTADPSRRPLLKRVWEYLNGTAIEIGSRPNS